MEAFVPFAFAVQTPLDASRLGRFRGRNARSGDKTCSVASVFADGDEPSGTRARAGGTSGAEEAAARQGAFARGTIRRARADGRPDASAACLGVPPARSPGAKTQPVLIVRYFSCACFGRWREAGREWAVPGASRGRGAPGDDARIARRTLQKGLDMWFMALSVYTTEYSSRPPAASNGRGDLWYGLEGSCGHCAANARSATRCGLNEPRAATARAAARRRANIGQTRGDVLLSARV